MIKIERYDKTKKKQWDKFISESINSTFLFYRDYMDYHADRFQDYSLLIYDDDKLITVIPANRNQNLFYSHSGLSYGGFVVNQKMNTIKMLDIFSIWLVYLGENDFNEIIYKSVPYIYHTQFCEFDKYALFTNDFELFRCEVSTLISIQNLKFKSNRKSGYNHGVKNGLVLRKNDNFEEYFKIVNNQLQKKYGINAVHNAKEMQLLFSRFPQNINIYGVYKDDIMLGGALLYIDKNVIHAQYLCTNEEGRKNRAMDFLIISLLRDHFNNYQYFDFGISTEQGGHFLNKALIRTKEEFGGTAVCFETYRKIL